jgi:hypothetical protein
MLQAEEGGRKAHCKCWKRRDAGTEHIWSKGVNALVLCFHLLLNDLHEQEVISGITLRVHFKRLLLDRAINYVER